MNEKDWRNPAIREAEKVLEEALANAERAEARAEEMNASLPDSKLSGDQVERIEQLVRAGKAPEEISALQRRIDAGELTWDDVSEGRALRDEGVQQAFSAGVPNMRHVKELLDEGHDLDDILEADPNRPAPDLEDEDDPPETFLR